MAVSEGPKGPKHGTMEGTKPTGKHIKFAYDYPGRDVPSAEKVRDAKNNQACLESGRGNSLGTSANGSHKGLKK